MSATTKSSVELQRLLERSQRLLAKSWNNQSLTGPESPLFAECARHLSEVLDFRSQLRLGDLDDKPLKSLASEVTRVAWYAAWLARDYSIEGWRKRLEGKPAVGRNTLNQATGYQAAGRRWLSVHLPFFDDQGRPVSTNHWGFPSQLGHEDSFVFFEGALLRHPDQFSTVPHRRDIPSLEWAFVGKPMQSFVPGQASLKNAFVEALTELGRSENRRFNDLSGAIIEDGASMSGYPDLDRLKGALIGGKLQIEKTDFKGRTARFPDKLCVEGPIVLTSCSVDVIEISPRLNASLLHLASTNVRGVLRLVDSGRLLPIEVSGSGASVASISAGGVELQDFRFGATAKALDFAGAKFLGTASFANSSIETADFSRALFAPPEKRVVDFSGTTIKSVTFEGADFLGKGTAAVKFRQANLEIADFSGAHFRGPVDFFDLKTKEILFREGASASGRRRAMFDKSVDFSADQKAAIKTASFARAKFGSSARFENREFVDRASFDGAQFTDMPVFLNSDFGHGTTFRGTEFGWSKCLKSNPLLRPIAARLPKIFSDQAKLVEDDNSTLEDIEREFRALRQRANALEDSPLSIAFHKQELKARHRRSRDSEVSTWESGLGRIYDLISSYGDSLSRPVFAFVVLWFAATLGYWIASDREQAFLGPAMSFAWTMQTKPFSYLDASVSRAALERPAQCETEISNRVEHPENVTEFCYSLRLVRERGWQLKAIAFVQSTVSVILVFLLLLGIRRKFQLN